MFWRTWLRAWFRRVTDLPNSADLHSPHLAGRYGRASWVCVVLGHAEAMHQVTDRGIGWVCPDCRRQHASRLRVFRGEIL